MYLRKLSMWSALGIAVLVACGEQEPSAQKEALPLAEVGDRGNHGSGSTLPD